MYAPYTLRGKRIFFRAFFFITTLMLLWATSAKAQVVKAFSKRTGSPAPANNTYRIKGNFTMMGNTNLTLTNYPAGDPSGGNSNSTMRFVDEDNDTSTWNSSMSELRLPVSAGSNSNCTKILFAGLYWTGRSSTSNQYSVSASRTLSYTGPTSYDSTGTYSVSSSGNNTAVKRTSYTLTVTRQGTGNYYYQYQFAATGDTTVTFQFLNTAPYIQYQKSSGSYNSGWIQPANQQVTNANNTRTVTFDPVVIDVNDVSIAVNKLVRDSRINNDRTSAAIATVRHYGTINTTTTQNQSKSFDKRQIRFKKEGQPYVTYTASNNNIYYDANSTYADIFSGFVDVTSYVRANGVGNYWAADMALVPGNGGSTGYFGCWSLVVVYENPGEKWRDVMIYDGHAFIQGNTSYTLPVSGFQAAQNGPVNVRMGIMAGEGDRDITGDYLQIQQKNTTNYSTLTHSGNTANNFFNSSIVTGGNNRIPNFTNNTGIDIAMFDLDNTNNSIIGNGQTATNLKYGTTQDLYTISVIALGIDAYVPDIAGVNTLTSPPTADTVLPGDTLTYSINIYNNGTEAINNAAVNILLPYTVSFIPGSGAVQYFYTSTGNQPVISSPQPPQSLNIDLGTIPLPSASNTGNLMATITYKVKVTEDCNILNTPPTCTPKVESNGYISGTGAYSGESFTNLPFILGYDSTSECSGAAVSGPLTSAIKVDQDWLDAHGCGNQGARNFTYCNPAGSSIPYGDISPSFPGGSRFYNESETVEYTEATGFPIVDGTVNFVAIPPGGATCDYPFTITITTNNNKPTPTPANVTYCLNASASPLSATPQSSGNTLYYYTQDTGGIAVLSLVPPTNTAGSTDYWVAEGPGVSCVGPRAKITVTVIPLPDATISINGATTVCEGAAAPVITIANTTDSAITVTYNVNGNNQQTISLTGNTAVNVPVSAAAAGTFTYSLVSAALQGSNACTVQLNNSVSYTVNPKPAGSISIASPICAGDNGVLTFIATAGTGPFDLIINGQAYNGINSGDPFNTTAVPTESTDYNLTQITDANTCINP